MAMNEAEKKIQAILFASGEPYERLRLTQLLDLNEETLDLMVNHLNDKLKQESLVILKLGNAYQMTTRPEYGSIIKEALEMRRNTPLSQAAMEILAIIAYNQPVTKSFIEQIRGIDSSSVIHSLVQKDLIEEAGRLEIPGRPISYKTTPNFLRCFGMSGIEALPKIPDQEAPTDIDFS